MANELFTLRTYGLGSILLFRYVVFYYTRTFGGFCFHNTLPASVGRTAAALPRLNSPPNSPQQHWQPMTDNIFSLVQPVLWRKADHEVGLDSTELLPTHSRCCTELNVVSVCKLYKHEEICPSFHELTQAPHPEVSATSCIKLYGLVPTIQCCTRTLYALLPLSDSRATVPRTSTHPALYILSS